MMSSAMNPIVVLSLGKAFGVPPGVSQTSDFIATQILETPLGALLVGADSKGVCLIEYTDMRMLHNYA